MLTWGPISFVAPWALAAAAVLPLLWWLLRVMPPAPLRVAFPPVRLLMALVSREETSAKSPLWLLLLRMALAVVVILAAAHPLLNATTRILGQGPVVMIIDDGWAAAANWPARRAILGGLLDQAEREQRPVVVVTTAPGEGGAGQASMQMLRAADARSVLAALQPKPWPTDREAALERGAPADARHRLTLGVDASLASTRGHFRRSGWL